MNRKNLAKLATYLESLPKNYKAFEMSMFFDHDDDPDEEILAKYAEKNGGVHTCGAVACAVGHGPAAGILFPKPTPKNPFWTHFGGKIYQPDWNKYSAEFLIDYESERAEWHWCFGGNWNEIDNSHHGAAARIRYLLDGKSPPRVRCYYDGLKPFDDSSAGKHHRRLYAEYRK